MKSINLISRICLALIACTIAACASVKPAFVEMREQSDRKIVLVVDEPHRYHPPISMRPVGMGIPLFDIFSGLVALNFEQRYDELHMRLSDQAQALQLWQNSPSPQTEFIQALQARLQAEGLTVEVRSAPFRLRGVGTSGRQSMQPPDDFTIVAGELAYGLRLDMGNCTLTYTLPCVRYSWVRLKKADANAKLVIEYQYDKTLPVIPSQQGAQVNLPGYRAELPQSDSDIRAFDQALRQLVTTAVQQLMDDIQGVKSAKH